MTSAFFLQIKETDDIMHNACWIFILAMSSGVTHDTYEESNFCSEWLFSQFSGNMRKWFGMATYSSIFAWRIPWTEEPVGLQSMGLQRVGHKWATNTHTHTHKDLGLNLCLMTLLQLTILITVVVTYKVTVSCLLHCISPTPIKIMIPKSLTLLTTSIVLKKLMNMKNAHVR